MKLMEWSSHFETGIEMVDAQHKGLVAIVNAAIPLLADASAANASALRELMDQLTDYANLHFAAEEIFMAGKGIDSGYQDVHRASHQTFVRELTAMRNELAEGDAAVGQKLLRFVVGWLSFHILTEDQHVARQLQAIADGIPPADAARIAGSEASPAINVLIDAMESLLALLTERNHQLAEANQRLETRVAERTAELEREKQALLEANARIEDAHEKLLQAEKMSAVGQLAAGVAHEINNPVGFVMSNVGTLGSYIKQMTGLIDAAEAVAGRLPQEHPDRAFWHAARTKAEIDFLREDIPDLLRESTDGLTRVKRIVADLKDFSHVDEGEWKAVDLNASLESTLNVVRNEIKYKAEVVRELVDLPAVTCIPSQIGQIFMNLLVNAGHAIETRGQITLRSGVLGDRVWIEIADTGKGIPPEIRRRIFEPFFTTKPVGKGTGLGLSIVWDIVERHKGSIDVDSTPGEGTCFRLTLPIERPEAEDAATAA